MILWLIFLIVIYILELDPLKICIFLTLLEFFRGMQLNRKYVDSSFLTFYDEECILRNLNKMKAFLSGVKISLTFQAVSLTILPFSFAYRMIVGFICYKNFYFLEYSEIFKFSIVLTLLCIISEALGRILDIILRVKNNH